MIQRLITSPIERLIKSPISPLSSAIRRYLTSGDATAEAFFELAGDITVDVSAGFEIEFYYVYVDTEIGVGSRSLGHATENTFLKLFNSDAGGNAGLMRLVLSGAFLDFTGFLSGVEQGELIKIRLYVTPADDTKIYAALNDATPVSRPTGPATSGNFNQIFTGGNTEYIPSELFDLKMWIGGDRHTGTLIDLPVAESGFNSYLDVLHNAADTPVPVTLSAGSLFDEATDGSASYTDGVIEIIKNSSGDGMVGWTFDSDLLDENHYVISFDIEALSGSGAAIQQWDDNWANTLSRSLYAYTGPVELLLTNAGKLRFVIQGWATGHVRISNIVIKQVGPYYGRANNFVIDDTREVYIDGYTITEVSQ